MTSYVALYGDPVEGNPTSRMQNAAFDAAGLDWRYLDIRIPTADLAAAVVAARTLAFGGLNLTIPHKVAAASFCDELDEVAARAGSVNTLIVRDGKVNGSSTDGRASLACRNSGSPESRTEWITTMFG